MPDVTERIKALAAEQEGFSLEDGVLTYHDVQDWLVEVLLLPMAAD